MISLDTRISELALTAKERRALELLEIRNVDEFMRLDLGQVTSMRWYGQKTYASLCATRRSLRRILAACKGAGANEAALLQDDVEVILPLTTRARKTLRRLGVSTVGELLAVDLRTARNIPGCAAVTYSHLVEAQAQLRSQFPAKEWPGTCTGTATTGSPPLEIRMIAAARAHAKPERWLLLPLFSGVRLDAITPSELHESYCADTPVEYLGLPTRVLRVLRDAGIECLGQLLLTCCKDLMGRKNIHKRSVDKTQREVAEFLRASLEDTRVHAVDCSSPSAFLASLVSPVLTDERQRRVFLLRLGWDGKPRSLGDIGQEYGVSRERVRQIEKSAYKKLTTWRARWALSPLWNCIVELLKEHSPLLTFESIVRELQRIHGWDYPLDTKVIQRLLPASPHLKGVETRGDGFCLCQASRSGSAL